MPSSPTRLLSGSNPRRPSSLAPHPPTPSPPPPSTMHHPCAPSPSRNLLRPAALPHVPRRRAGRRPHRAGAGTHARAGCADPAGVPAVWLVFAHQEHRRVRRRTQGPAGRSTCYAAARPHSRRRPCHARSAQSCMQVLPALQLPAPPHAPRTCKSQRPLLFSSTPGEPGRLPPARPTHHPGPPRRATCATAARL